MRRVLIALLAAACLGVGAGGRPSEAHDSDRAAPERPPNVLVIMTDDQRQGLGVMPKTRRWFRAGTRFENAFATTPLCCPSRASILSGRYAHNHGVIQNEDGAWRELDTDETFPVYLQRAGYRTAIFGKYLNRFPLEEAPPGFDEWALKETDQKVAYYGADWSINGDVRRVDRYSTDFIAGLGERFIRDAEEPWLLFLTVAAPHLPFTPAPRHADASVERWRGNPAIDEADRSDKPPYVQASSTTFHRQAWVRANQFRTLMSVDDLVGRVKRTLRETGQSSNTLAFYMTDNAYTWGEHGLHIKTVPYMDSIRIPLMIRWPGRVAAGATDDRLVANIDIAPTVMEAAELEPDAPMDGRSLLGPHSRDRLLTENLYPYKQAPRWAGLVTPDRHYIETYDENWVPTWHEEYDLAADPWELENLLWNGASTVPSPALAVQLAADLRCRDTSCP